MSSDAPVSEAARGRPLAEALTALTHHDWQAAYDAAGPLDPPEPDSVAQAERLDARAAAAWWLGHIDDCIEAREAAYAIYDREAQPRAAAQCAVRLWEHYSFKAQPNIGGAWLRRARQRVEHDTECVTYGNVVLREIEVAHGSGELELAAARVPEIIDLGR